MAKASAKKAPKKKATKEQAEAQEPQETEEVPDHLPNETKADKFRRIAKARTLKVLHAMELLGNLAGPGYEYTSEQASKICVRLDRGVRELHERFEGTKEEFDL